MITLLYGVQINTLSNPFRYCGIQLELGEFLPRKVDFGGIQITLSDIIKPLNKLQTIAFRETIDASTHKSLIGGDEVTVAKDTIPPLIPYYIKSTMTLRNKLDQKIFQNRLQDYFLIENIEPHQLTRLVQTSQTKEAAEPSNHFLRHQQPQSIATRISSEQIRSLTTQFILLEDVRHFDLICNHSKGKNLHHIKFLEHSYYLVRSSNPENVKSFILDDELHISGKDFLSKINNSYPEVIFDTPGMGKSTVLTNLAYQLKQQMPFEYVVYFQMQDLVNRLLVKNGKIDISLIESEILDTISTNKFGSFINRELFNIPNRLFHLFLDAFDEVNSGDQKVANNIIKVLNDNRYRFKIYVTSRLHQGSTLEKICGVFGYGILPFQLKEQIDFLVEYWEKQYNVENSKEVLALAKNLLSVFREKITSKDREITGIPLQCRMLADVYAKDAQSKLLSLKSSKIVMNTIYDMYREYFSQKFPNTFLQIGKSQLLDLHFKLALDILFPEFSKKVDFGLDCTSQQEIFSAGIVELSRSGKQQFVHRTFAEFLVAELFGSLMYSGQVHQKFPCKLF